MLTVNLLPEGARKATKSPIEQLHRTPLMWVVVGGMALFALALLIPRGLYRHQLTDLQAKIDVLQPKKQEVDQIQQLVQRLRSQQSAFQGLRQGQGLWSERLNILSGLTPPGIWYTELTLDQTRGLSIEGSAISQGGSEMVQVGRLREDLKNHPYFASTIQDVQIESITRMQDGEVEIVQFRLVCPLHETATP